MWWCGGHCMIAVPGWITNVLGDRESLTTLYPGFHRQSHWAGAKAPKSTFCSAPTLVMQAWDRAACPSHHPRGHQASPQGWRGGARSASRAHMSDPTALSLTSDKNTTSRVDCTGSFCRPHSHPVMVCSAAPRARE